MSLPKTISRYRGAVLEVRTGPEFWPTGRRYVLVSPRGRTFIVSHARSLVLEALMEFGPLSRTKLTEAIYGLTLQGGELVTLHTLICRLRRQMGSAAIRSWMPRGEREAMYGFDPAGIGREAPVLRPRFGMTLVHTSGKDSDVGAAQARG